MRKPRPFKPYGEEVARVIHSNDEDGFTGLIAVKVERIPMFMNDVQATRLAAWMIRAAEWIRSREGK